MKIHSTFWNSNLGIFILSAIFLTLIPFAYTNIQGSITKRKLYYEQRIKISSEISHRLNTVKLLTIDNIRPYQIKDIRLATFGIKETLEPEYYNFNPIFSEFDNSTLLSLIYQLNNITYSEEQKETNAALEQAIREIKHLVDELVLNPDYRRKVILNENSWTYEYSFNDSMKNKVDKLVRGIAEDWQEKWK